MVPSTWCSGIAGHDSGVHLSLTVSRWADRGSAYDVHPASMLPSACGILRQLARIPKDTCLSQLPGGPTETVHLICNGGCHPCRSHKQGQATSHILEDGLEQAQPYRLFSRQAALLDIPRPSDCSSTHMHYATSFTCAQLTSLPVDAVKSAVLSLNARD